MTKPSQLKPQAAEVDVELNKDATAQVSYFKPSDTWYSGIRYRTEINGERGWAKNGITVPVSYTEDAIRAWVDAFNQGTGSSLVVGTHLIHFTMREHMVVKQALEIMLEQYLSIPTPSEGNQYDIESLQMALKTLEGNGEED